MHYITVGPGLRVSIAGLGTTTKPARSISDADRNSRWRRCPARPRRAASAIQSRARCSGQWPLDGVSVGSEKSGPTRTRKAAAVDDEAAPAILFAEQH
jgi:hypothetical protein